MTKPKITVISDEFHPNLEKVLGYLQKKNLEYIELRDVALSSVEKKRIGKYSDEELDKLMKVLDDYGFKVSALGSPLFNKKFPKSPKAQDEIFTQLTRYSEIAKKLNTKNIRVFSFAPEPRDLKREYTNPNSEFIKQFNLITKILREAGEIVAENDLCLGLENEAPLFGNTVNNSINLLNEINSKNVGFLFDPGNMWRHKDDETLENLKKIYPLTSYTHIKDVGKTFFGGRKFVVNGKGIIPFVPIFKDMLEMGYSSYYSVETHIHKNKWDSSAKCLDGLISLLGQAGWDISEFN